MRNVIRGEILHFLADPTKNELADCMQYWPDGILITNHGLIEAVGAAEDLLPTLPHELVIDHKPNCLILPGFVDTHVHYPQTDMIASYGEQLLTWLENYTYPTERKFADEAHATDVAQFFIDQLLSSGTTTALVFGTVHKTSVNAFFTVAQQHKLRMICGKVLMDQNCPDFLSDTPESAYQDSKELIEKWHDTDRLSYAVTPRFAPTCSKAQLDKAGQLLKEFPTVYLHTHLSENKKEIDWVNELFPNDNGYLEVYDSSSLLGKRSIFAHGVHLSDDECCRLAETDSSIAFCPSSNLFLGSGLFNLPQAEHYDVSVGLGTDIGAGTSFSLLRTMGEAYKTQQLRSHCLTPFKSFYLATLGGAMALNLQDKIGNFMPGKEADFVVLDYNSTPLMARRMAHCNSIEEKLFVLTMLADERAVSATYIMGQSVSINQYDT